jgi:hypothetical protein
LKNETDSDEEEKNPQNNWAKFKGGNIQGDSDDDT